jgi:hypothetical protein
MALDEQLRRTFESLSDKLHAETERQLVTLRETLGAEFENERTAAVAQAVADARKTAEKEAVAQLNAIVAATEARGKEALTRAVEQATTQAREEGIKLGRDEGIKLGRDDGIKLGREEGIKLGRDEGIKLGRDEGIKLGRDDGIKLGREEGIKLGRDEGVKLGRDEGVKLGRDEGVKLGREEGIKLGREEGSKLGREEGIKLGREEGSKLGREEGIKLGREEGSKLGREEGIKLGRDEGIKTGREEGIKLGRDEGIKLGRDEGIKLGRDEGVKLGRDEGIKQGREEGRREGRETGVREGAEAAAEAALAQFKSAELSASERAISAIRAIDSAGSLTEVLDALASSAGREARRVAVLLVRNGQLRGWRFMGFGPSLDERQDVEIRSAEAGVIAEAARSGAAVSADSAVKRSIPKFADLPPGRELLAVPVQMSGQSIAVLYADQGPSGISTNLAWPATLEVLARHAARCLEAITAYRAAQVLTERPELPSADTPSNPAADNAEEIESARRYARLLVSEIKLYHESAVVAGRRERDLASRLGGEIARARVHYEQRISDAVRAKADYFHEELVRTLADGDGSLLEARR